ncbi:MAG: DEAD/DEAH box helicase, partial [Kiritimatiellae bacterium]|nr:DEAD/DEAH box helicase [Kiritimatiellia bacterium]
MKLRPYQSEAIAAVEREWDAGRRRTLLVLPTGCGKTIVFCKLAEKRVASGDRVLILAHRGELLEQAADKLLKATGLRASVEKAEQTCFGEWFRVVVGSVQTLMNEARLSLFEPDFFGTIVVDEAHHALSASYQRVLQHFDGARVLGVTATPDRGDMRSLGAYFDSLAFEYSIARAVRDGFLCPIRAQTVPIKLDISHVASTAGDYSADGVGAAIDPYLDQIAAEIKSRCSTRKTIVFTPLVATSKKMLGHFAALGMADRVREVNGASADRAETLAWFSSAGPGSVLLNSMLLTEGYDEPGVSCVVVLRATKVRSLYAQMVGRGTRLSPETGKGNMLLLDFLWLSAKHNLCRPASLLAEDEEVAQQAAKDAEDGRERDLAEAVETAEGETVAAREEALVEELRRLRSKSERLVDPLQYAMSILDEDLAHYRPAFGWEAERTSADSVKKLEKAGIDPIAVKSEGMARKLLDALGFADSFRKMDDKQRARVEEAYQRYRENAEVMAAHPVKGTDGGFFNRGFYSGVGSLAGMANQTAAAWDEVLAGAAAGAAIGAATGAAAGGVGAIPGA